MPTMKETVTYPSANGTDQIVAKICKPSLAPIKGIVQISHGMCEYIDRYDEFMDFLLANNYAVCGNDHLGHGKSAASAEALGFFAEKDGAACLVEDLHTLTGLVKAAVPGVPLFLLGHSMGSFLVRRTVQLRPSMFDGLILSGTGDGQGAAGRLALQIVTAACFFMGQEHYSPKIKKMLFGGFNRGIANPQSEFDWLTRDREVVSRYLEDDWCGFLCSNGFYHELLQGIQLANTPHNIAGMRKDMPVYLFSGDCDPVGSMGKGVQHVRNLFLDAGLQDVTMELYAGGRHEMLNELNYDIVMDDLLQWLNHKIDAMQ